MAVDGFSLPIEKNCTKLEISLVGLMNGEQERRAPFYIAGDGIKVGFASQHRN